MLWPRHCDHGPLRRPALDRVWSAHGPACGLSRAGNVAEGSGAGQQDEEGRRPEPAALDQGQDATAAAVGAMIPAEANRRSAPCDRIHDQTALATPCPAD